MQAQQVCYTVTHSHTVASFLNLSLCGLIALPPSRDRMSCSYSPHPPSNQVTCSQQPATVAAAVQGLTRVQPTPHLYLRALCDASSNSWRCCWAVCALQAELALVDSQAAAHTAV